VCGSASAKQAADLYRHLRYAEEYRKAGIIELENGRISCSGEIQPANVPGEMAGRRWVHGFDAATLRPGGWHETVDNAGNVRQVRPQLNNGRAAMNGSFPRPSAPKQTISFRPRVAKTNWLEVYFHPLTHKGKATRNRAHQ
jgi:hypothetical protein